MDASHFHALDRLNVAGSDKWGSLEHNTRGLHDWERHAIQRHFHGASTIAVTSVGGGREAFALERMGYRVRSFECNCDLVASANRNAAALGLQTVTSEMERDRAPTLGDDVHGVIVGWGAYMLVAGRERRIAFLRALGEQLAAGAPVLVSYFLRRAGRDGALDARIGRIASGVRRLRRRPLPEPGDTLDGNFRHRFTHAEARAEIEQAGFRVVHWADDGYPHMVGVRTREPRTGTA